jgi:hypothetical protein
MTSVTLDQAERIIDAIIERGAAATSAPCCAALRNTDFGVNKNANRAI